MFQVDSMMGPRTVNVEHTNPNDAAGGAGAGGGGDFSNPPPAGDSNPAGGEGGGWFKSLHNSNCTIFLAIPSSITS